jgi:hypothetical protein
LEDKKEVIDSMDELRGAGPSRETSNEADSNGRPPEPREADKSNDNESQAPITEDEMIVTTGTSGLNGGEIFTRTEELFCHPTQGITFDSTRHFARIFDSFNLNSSPTCTQSVFKEDEAKVEEVAEIGNNEKLWSLIHTHRVEEVIPTESRR